jgi:hypothetical protein
VGLTVKAAGYKETPVSFVPEKDDAVPVEMAKEKGRVPPQPNGSGPGIHKDLERF